MSINLAISVITSHVPLTLIFIGVGFLILGLCNPTFKPFNISPASEFTAIRKIIILVAFVFLLPGMVFQFFPPGPPQIPKPSVPTATLAPTPSITAPTSITSTAVPPAQSSTLVSSLIPAGQQPVINDPLKDNAQGYQWDIDNSATGSCNFVQGHYLLTAPAGSNGEGCNTEASNSVFSNFVYQIQMTILSGVDNSQAGAGPIFRVNTSGSGQQYQVTFDEKGDWDVETDVQNLSGASCANPCPNFHQGFGQPNIITIRASGSSIQIQINGYPLGSYTDSTYSTGYIGVQLTPGTDNGSVAFSNVRVWTL
jgi:hypothetical protein